MSSMKFLLFPVLLFLILSSGCSKDSEAPVIIAFKVNGTATAAMNGAHNLGSTVSFEVEVTDNAELGAYQIKNEFLGSLLLASGPLTGTGQAISYNFLIDVADYSAGDNILLSFIIEDLRGSSTIRSYTINVQ